MNVIFTVPAVPVAQPRQRHRVMFGSKGAFAHNFTPSKHPVNDFKATVRLAYVDAIQLAKPTLTGAERIELRLTFHMPRPKAMIWKTRPMPAVPHLCKPDIDNLCKSVKDALTGLAWRDDSQVWSLHAEKLYCRGDLTPCVGIHISWEV